MKLEENLSFYMLLLHEINLKLFAAVVFRVKNVEFNKIKKDFFK